jgi:hypothetical protein
MNETNLVGELSVLLAEERAKNAELHDLIGASLEVYTTGALAKVKVRYENIIAEIMLKELLMDIPSVDRAFISKPMLDRETKRRSSSIPVLIIGSFKSRDLLDLTLKIALELKRDLILLKYSSEAWAKMLAVGQNFAVKAEASDKIILK